MTRKTPSRPTFQQLHNQRRTTAFVGRLDELSTYEENLRYGVDDPRRRFIFAVDGQGGMGKTSLLHRFRDLANAAEAAVAWADEGAQDVLALMRIWAVQLDTGNGSFRTFLDKEHAYRVRRHELEADPSLPTEVAELLGRAVGRGGVILGRRIPIAGAALDFVDEAKAGETIGRASMALAQRLGSKQDLDLVSRPLDTMTPAFIQGLTAIDRPLALFLDTFEATSAITEKWLLDLLSERYGGFPGDIRLTIAGRDPLDPNRWHDFDSMMVRFTLTPLSVKTARDLLARNGVISERVIEVMLELSGRVPLLLATLAAQSPDTHAEIADPTDTAVERFLKWVDRPAERQLALDAALPRLLNEDVIDLLTETDDRQLYTWLKSLPFVVERGGRRVYHPTVRDQMVRQQRRESQGNWINIHHRLAGYYEQQHKAALASANSDRAHDMAVERSFHRVAAARQVTHADLLDWAGSLTLPHRARNLTAAIRQAELESNPDGAYWGQRLSEAIDTLPDESAAALRCVDQILGLCAPDLDDRVKAGQFRARGALCLNTGHPDEAIIDFERARALDTTTSVAMPLAAARAATRDFAGAARELADITSADEKLGLPFTDALLMRAHFEQEANRPTDALATLELCLSHQPSYAEARFARANIFADAGSTDDALAELGLARVAAPDTTHRAYHYAASLLLEADRLDEAQRSVVTAIGSEADCVGCWMLLGRILQARKRPTVLIPTDIASVETGEAQLTSILLGRAVALEEVGLHQAALAEYSRAIEEDPDNGAAWAYRGSLRLEHDSRSAGFEDLAKAIALKPDWPWPYIRRAAESRADQPEGALADASRAIHLEGCPAIAWYLRAHIALDQARPLAAREDLEEYERRAPKESNTHLLQARIHEALEDYPAALRALDIVKQNGSSGLDVCNQRGLLLSYLGRYDEALEEFGRGEQSPEVMYNLAVAAVLAGHNDADRRIAAASEVLHAVRITAPHVTCYGKAGIAAALGDASKALDGLGRALVLHTDVRSWALKDMAWRDLRSTPEFVDLLSGFPVDKAV
jgi:tetratricopeptide (TPR) repeat protein